MARVRGPSPICRQVVHYTYPSPGVGFCHARMHRVYVRAGAKGQLCPVGWVCPTCTGFVPEEDFGHPTVRPATADEEEAFRRRG